LAELASLRYRLLWAKMRTRHGRILFLLGGLLFGLVAALALLRGFSGGLVAIRSGHAERTAQDALSILFVQAILVANLLGAGMNEIFSETELRRYPLTSLERLAARHAIAMLDPFWFVYLTFYLGLACGLSVFGNGALLPATVAACLLFLSTYIAARVAGLSVDHLISRKAGIEILIVGAAATASVIAYIVRALDADATRLEAFYPWMKYSPAFAAAQAMTQPGLSGLLIILTWLVGLVLALVWLERHPPRQTRLRRGGIIWDTFLDRVGDRFGAQLGPLVTFWLRFHLRNTITRRMMWMAPLTFAVITYSLYRARHRAHHYELFMAALGVLPFAAYMASWRIAANQFGYLGGGLRRLLLLPTRPASLLGSSTFAATILSLVMSLAFVIGWVILAPFPFDARMVVMLGCSAATGVLFLQAVSVWVTIYSPRQGNYFLKIGNDCSLAGNSVLLLGFAGAFLPPIVNYLWPGATAPEGWRILLPFPAIAAGAYFATLALAGRAFAGRREKLLAKVEGSA
jgi:hypothetical protein